MDWFALSTSWIPCTSHQPVGIRMATSNPSPKPSDGEKVYGAKRIAASYEEDLSDAVANLKVTRPTSEDLQATKVPGKKRELDTKVSASKRYESFVPRGHSDEKFVNLSLVISNLPSFIGEHVKLGSNEQFPGEAPDEVSGKSRRKSCPPWPTSRPDRIYYIDCDYI